MNKIHVESKDLQKIKSTLIEINPDFWEYYTTFDIETLEPVYCIDGYFVEGANDGRECRPLED